MSGSNILFNGLEKAAKRMAIMRKELDSGGYDIPGDGSTKRDIAALLEVGEWALSVAPCHLAGFTHKPNCHYCALDRALVALGEIG